MSIAFIISKTYPQQVFEVKLNPNSTDIEMLNHMVEIRGIENHMLVHLSDNDYQMLAAFMR